MRTAIIVLLLGSSASATAGTAAQVAQLRREVDSLATALEDLRRSSGDELQALRAERIELERQVRIERLRKETLERLRRQMASQAETVNAALNAWVGPASLAIDAARNYVSESLPFQRSRRLERLNEISDYLTRGSPDPARAMRELWRFLEQERAMGREVALADQPIDVAGKRRLARVARLGMALLYFKTSDGQFGYARPDADGWTFELGQDPELESVLAELFDKFEAGEKLGLHALPLPSLEP